MLLTIAPVGTIESSMRALVHDATVMKCASEVARLRMHGVSRVATPKTTILFSILPSIPSWIDQLRRSASSDGDAGGALAGVLRAHCERIRSGAGAGIGRDRRRRIGDGRAGPGRRRTDGVEARRSPASRGRIGGALGHALKAMLTARRSCPDPSCARE